MRVRCSGGIFGALLLAQLCLQPGHSRNWGVRWQVWSRTAKQYSNQTDLGIYWQFVHLFFRCSMRADTGGWNNLYLYNDKPTYVLFCRVLWFFPWFPRFSPNVSATSDLYPLPPGQRRCGGWFGRGSWQGWRWRPQWRSAEGQVLLALSVARWFDFDVTLW